MATQIPGQEDPCSTDLLTCTCLYLNLSREITKRAGAQKIESEREIGISAMGHGRCSDAKSGERRAAAASLACPVPPRS